jgi:hypothetical protein
MEAHKGAAWLRAAVMGLADIEGPAPQIIYVVARALVITDRAMPLWA